MFGARSQIVGLAQSHAWAGAGSSPVRTFEKGKSNMSGPDPWQQLTRMITGSWTSRAVYAAAKLRLADHLADGPRPAEEKPFDIVRQRKGRP